MKRTKIVLSEEPHIKKDGMVILRFKHPIRKLITGDLDACLRGNGFVYDLSKDGENVLHLKPAEGTSKTIQSPKMLGEVLKTCCISLSVEY